MVKPYTVEELAKISIEDIRKLRWFGSFEMDMRNFDIVTVFIGNPEKSIEEKFEAVFILLKDGMGIDAEKTDESELRLEEGELETSTGRLTTGYYDENGLPKLIVNVSIGVEETNISRK